MKHLSLLLALFAYQALGSAVPAKRGAADISSDDEAVVYAWQAGMSAKDAAQMVPRADGMVADSDDEAVVYAWGKMNEQ
ncbi:hypothetical protein F5Y08DRAFT_346659 [Xylaria arbuscula]|nr:hypothetical protein F5Y08DRAFT_346659 [Xylaria arbuscula]